MESLIEIGLNLNGGFKGSSYCKWQTGIFENKLYISLSKKLKGLKIYAIGLQEIVANRDINYKFALWN